jgi:hypothetical protein
MEHDGIKITLDELKLCYSASLDALQSLKDTRVGKYYDVTDYRLFRTVNDRFKYFFDVVKKGVSVAYLRFGLYTEVEEGDDTGTYVYLKVQNSVLYDERELHNLLELLVQLGLAFHHFTAIDLAVDTPFSVPLLIKRLMSKPYITTILNGKAITDRKRILPGFHFDYSTTLDRIKHPSVTIKQRKAILNKEEGITVQAYDKRAEVDNQSDKQYILDYYGNPCRLYRLEVRLHYQEIKDYLKLKSITAKSSLVFNQTFLCDMFFYHLSSVIRFTRGRTKILWSDLLACRGRGALTNSPAIAHERNKKSK